MIEFEDGAHHFKPAKLDPLTISEDYKIKWRKTKTDLSKVAMDQEMVSGSHSRSFGAFTGRAIQMYLCQMKKPRGLDLALLKPIDLELVNKSINQTFKGIGKDKYESCNCFGLAVITTSSLIFGSGLNIKKLHDFIRRDTLIQISKGLSSTEKLANALTGEHFHKDMRLVTNKIKKIKDGIK